MPGQRELQKKHIKDLGDDKLADLANKCQHIPCQYSKKYIYTNFRHVSPIHIARMCIKSKHTKTTLAVSSEKLTHLQTIIHCPRSCNLTVDTSDMLSYCPPDRFICFKYMRNKYYRNHITRPRIYSQKLYIPLSYGRSLPELILSDLGLMDLISWYFLAVWNP